VVVCKSADPESKGLVERANGYLETSFLPGRRFASPDDFNAQLAEWTALVNTRTRRALGCAPADRIAADRAAMLALPPVAPETGLGRRQRTVTTCRSVPALDRRIGASRGSTISERKRIQIIHSGLASCDGRIMSPGASLDASWRPNWADG
jgi:hypothetical protein